VELAGNLASIAITYLIARGLASLEDEEIKRQLNALPVEKRLQFHFLDLLNQQIDAGPSVTKFYANVTVQYEFLRTVVAYDFAQQSRVFQGVTLEALVIGARPLNLQQEELGDQRISSQYSTSGTDKLTVTFPIELKPLPRDAILEELDKRIEATWKTPNDRAAVQRGWLEHLRAQFAGSGGADHR
jgi:hypothetical protein